MLSSKNKKKGKTWQENPSKQYSFDEVHNAKDNIINIRGILAHWITSLHMSVKYEY